MGREKAIRMYLKKYEKVYYEKKELIDKKNTLLIVMQNAKAIEYSGMPHVSSGKKKDLSDYVVKLDGYYTRICKLERLLEKLRKKYMKMFMRLTKNEAAVMTKLYIELKDWNTVAQEVNRSRAQVNRYHISALEKLTERDKAEH